MKNQRKRIGLTVDPKLAEYLEFWAKAQRKTVAGFVKELMLRSIDEREDAYFSKLADKVDIDGVKTISHEEFWQ